MKRVIVDYKKLTEEILNMLVEKYPDGYNDSDIITFRNASGELIEAVEVKTDETIYLVKVSVRLEQSMIDYADEEDEDDNDVVDDSDGVDAENEIEFNEASDDDEQDE